MGIRGQTIINIEQLLSLLNIDHYQTFQQLHRHWVEEELQRDCLKRDAFWSESMAVGSERFVENTKELLKSRAFHLKCKPVGDQYLLNESEAIYQVDFPTDKTRLRLENSYFWGDNVVNTNR